MQAHVGPVLAQRAGLTVIDCRACGWAHLDPLPIVDDAYYRDTFWSEKGAGWLARYEAERDWLDMRHGDWLSVVEEHTAGRALLDVGSGYGFLATTAFERGWSASGLEPSSEAIDYARQNAPEPAAGRMVTYRQGQWEDDARASELGCPAYDCISALWLLEHLPDPRAFLAWAKAHLAPGGVLLLAVPNEWNRLQAEANKRTKTPNWWLHPTHLHYWSAPTLYGLLGRAGFRVVDAYGTNPMEQWIIEGTDYPGNEALGDKLHGEVRRFELGMTRPYRLYAGRAMARQAIGRDLIVFCKVNDGTGQ